MKRASIVIGLLAFTVAGACFFCGLTLMFDSLERLHLGPSNPGPIISTLRMGIALGSIAFFLSGLGFYLTLKHARMAHH